MAFRVGLGQVGAVAFRVSLGQVGVVAFRVGLGQVGVVAFRVGLGQLGLVAFSMGLGQVGLWYTGWDWWGLWHSGWGLDLWGLWHSGWGWDRWGLWHSGWGWGWDRWGGGGREGRGSKGGFCNKTSSSLNYQRKRQFDVTLSNLQTDKHTNALQLFMLNLTTTLLLSHGTQRLMAKLTYAKDCDTRRHHLSCPSQVCVTHMIKIN